MNQNVKIAKELVKLAEKLVAGYPDTDDVDDRLVYENDYSYDIQQDLEESGYYDPQDDNNDDPAIASQQGKYVKFTGHIIWGKINGTVERATFDLNKQKSPKIKFYKGIWKNGTFSDGYWQNGTWEDGVFYYSVWKNGTWKKGEFVGDKKTGLGQWHNGTWEDGTWYEGTWMNGTWKNGQFDDGYWCGGTWKKGTWYGGKDKDGNYHSQGDSPDKWE